MRHESPNPDYVGPSAKLTAQQVREIRELSKTRVNSWIAEQYGVREQTIYNVVKGKSWTNVQ